MLIEGPLTKYEFTREGRFIREDRQNLEWNAENKKNEKYGKGWQKWWWKQQCRGQEKYEKSKTTCTMTTTTVHTHYSQSEFSSRVVNNSFSLSKTFHSFSHLLYLLKKEKPLTQIQNTLCLNCKINKGNINVVC